jgi:hypothetical protein
MPLDIKQYQDQSGRSIDLGGDRVSILFYDAIETDSNCSFIVQLQVAGYQLTEDQKWMMSKTHKRPAFFKVAEIDRRIPQRQSYLDGLLIQTRCVQCASCSKLFSN